MKNLFKLLITAVFLISISCNESNNIPETLDIENTPVISKENISAENIDKKTVWKVNSKELDDGFHYLDTPNGNKFFIEMSKGKPIAMYVTNKAGKVNKGFLDLGNNKLEFSCSSFGCICSGDDDCNDMFSTNACGRFAICIGEPPVCYCER